MGLGSHTQISDRALAAYLLDTAVAEACIGRVAIVAGNPARPGTISQGGAA